MPSSVHGKHTSESDFYNIMSTQSDAGGPSSTGGPASTSSPYNMHTAQSGPTSQQGFSIESFDFGADFSLPSSLDELSIFNNGGQANHANGHSSHASHSGSQASPENTSLTHGSGGIASVRNKSGMTGGGAASSNNSVTGSPRSVHFSPRTTMREQVLHATATSRRQSPHTLSMSSNDGVNASSSGSNGGNDGPTGLSINTDDLQGLLQSIEASAVSQQQRQQEIQGGNLSIGELEKLLSEKEHMERVQSMQTAFLRQQVEALQRQNPGTQVLQGQHHSAGSDSSLSQSTAGMNASQLMQQFQQLTSQQNGARMFSSAPFSLPDAMGMQTNQAYSSQAKQGLSSGVNQYGLITPVSSGAFSQAQYGQAPFVSPLNMPSSSQAQLMDPSRVHDPGMVNGSFTPLESPAITPASVFSNVGSTATSADLFSPLTSPALRPQGHPHDVMSMQMSPFHGPTQVKGRSKGRGAPGASPNALTATKSIPRKNRSTTAEARANRARASPLVKPTLPSSTTNQTRKRNESASGSMPSPLGPNVPVSASRPGSRRASQSESGDSKRPSQAFPPLSAGSGTAKPMDASPSETAASTPSPIEMPPPNGKPMTPSSIMGTQHHDQVKRSSSSDEGKSQSNGSTSSQQSLRPAKQPKAGSEGASGNGGNKQVSFAPQSPGGLQSIMPGGLSSQEHEDWVSTMRSTGGLESRRTSHKAAEQKRRDSLKFCFDELRGMLPAITLDDDVPGGSMLGPDGLIEDQDQEGFSIEEVGDLESARIANRAISKVALLRHSNEYLVRLKHRMGRRDRDLALCRREIMDLRARLGLPVPPELPALTASIAGAAAMMGHNMSGILGGVDGMTDQNYPHQAAVIAAMQQQQQQQQQHHLQQQQQQQHQQQQMQAGSLADFTQTMHLPSNVTSMDTSS